MNKDTLQHAQDPASAIISRFDALRADCESRRAALQQKAEEARAKALHYQGIAARKMTLFHSLTDQIIETRASWLDEVVVPLVEEVNRVTGLRFDTSDLRTFGLRAACPVFHDASDGSGNPRHYSLTFTPHLDRDSNRFSLWLDTGRKDRVTEPGSIADLNGFDNVSEQVTSFQVVIDNLRRRFPDLSEKLQPLSHEK